MGPPESTTQMASQSVQPFLHRMSSGMPRHVFSLKIVPWHEAIWTHLIHASFGSPECTPQMASRSVQSFLQGRRTWTVQSYSSGGANVHPMQHMLPWAHPSPQLKRHLNRFNIQVNLYIGQPVIASNSS